MRTDTKLLVGLKDWSRDNSRIIPPNTAAAKNVNGVSASEMGLFIDERGYYHTSGFVGLGWLKDFKGKVIIDKHSGKRLAIHIKPRFEVEPWEMLVKVMNDSEYELYTKGRLDFFFCIHTNESLIPVESSERGGELLAAISFVKECYNICKKRLHSEMHFAEANFNGKVVGTIQVPKQIKYNISQAREDRVYCRYPVFSIDTLENQILKAALQKAKKIFWENRINLKDLGGIWRYSENALKGVKTVSISKNDFNKTNLTGFNSYYKTVIELAKTLLISEGINDLKEGMAKEKKYILPYSINMELLFEFYVRAIIKEYLKKNNHLGIELDQYRNIHENPLTTLIESDSNVYLMKNYIPDIALVDVRNGVRKYIAVFDVKYQNYVGRVYSDTRRHNSHQLLFYMLLMNTTKCGFIFPKANNTYQQFKNYHLNIQNGDESAMGERLYTQCQIEFEAKSQFDFAENMIRYVLESE